MTDKCEVDSQAWNCFLRLLAVVFFGILAATEACPAANTLPVGSAHSAASAESGASSPPVSSQRGAPTATSAAPDGPERGTTTPANAPVALGSIAAILVVLWFGLESERLLKQHELDKLKAEVKDLKAEVETLKPPLSERCTADAHGSDAGPKRA